jgi:crotonobetainyl-CoA:carnitine CoA-transferase CaiB-like acyl-CoA transferase
LCKILDITIEDESLKTNRGRIEKRDIVTKMIQDKLNLKSKEEIMNEMKEGGIPYSEIMNVKRFFD